MSKKYFLKLLVYFLLFFPISLVFATKIPDITISRLGGFLNHVADWLYYFLTIGAVIAIVIGGSMFLFSGGEPGKVATGKKMVIYALLAIMVSSVAWVLVNYVYSYFA